MKTVIEMAREVGFTDGELYFMTTMLERFATLVRADERELRSLRWDEYIAKAIEAEREACAKVCDGAVAALLKEESNKDLIELAVGLRDAIRARGQA